MKKSLKIAGMALPGPLVEGESRVYACTVAVWRRVVLFSYVWKLISYTNSNFSWKKFSLSFSFSAPTDTLFGVSSITICWHKYSVFVTSTA